jgi:ribosomal protein S12 methylthiotransferase
MTIQEKAYYLITLGCAKNLVDSNAIAQLMDQQGMFPVEKASKAKYLIVNTCGFIDSAREETISVLQNLARHKKPDQLLIAAGCMTQRYRETMLKMSPGIDGMFGTRHWMDIINVIDKITEKHDHHPYLYFPKTDSMGADEKDARAIAIQGKSSYLKIADGCRRQCAFCAIPLIKGSLVSRPLERIIQDAIYLETQGMKEINLVAQDVTDYGHDQGMKDGLVKLLTQMLPRIKNVPWIRLLYTFPGYVSRDLISLMATQPQILPYLDLPLQHADPQVLKAMQRPSDIGWVRDTISEMREKIPGLSLRTTFIVGYPGETDQAFQHLFDFAEEMRFDHLGAFTYSFEKGTPAEPSGDPIPEDIKNNRLETLMSLQAQISLKNNQSMIGKKMDVLVEGVDSDKQILVGRSFRDAPEVDGLVIVEGQGEIGDLIQVQITSAIKHDLIAQKM